MEIYDKSDKGFVEVWLTNEEQNSFDRHELTNMILKRTGNNKCIIAFFLSGKEKLYQNTEHLLLMNLGCA